MSWTWRRLVPRIVKARAWLGAAVFAVLLIGMSAVMLVLLSGLTKAWWSMALATALMIAALAPFLYIGVSSVREGLARVTRRTNAQIRTADEEAVREKARQEEALANGLPGRVSIAQDDRAAGALSTPAEPGALSKPGERKQTT